MKIKKLWNNKILIKVLAKILGFDIIIKNDNITIKVDTKRGKKNIIKVIERLGEYLKHETNN